MDCSPPGSSVHGILQTRILQCVAIPFSGDLPNPSLGIKPKCPSLPADSLQSAVYINKYIGSNSFANISVTKYKRAIFEGVILSKDL